MERCRICQQEAVFIAVLHDGARVPYCEKHLPDWDQAKEGAYEALLKALLRSIDS